MRPHGSIRLPQCVKGGLVAGGVVLAVHGFTPFVGEAAAAEMTVVMNGEMEPPADLKSFKAMTFVVDVPAGLEIPLHSHDGKGQVLLVDGELTIKSLDGKEAVYKTGDVWIEEVGNVHGGVNSGSGTARLVWTILLPEGAELEVPYKQ